MTGPLKVLKFSCRVLDFSNIHRGYYTVARRYEFYFRVAKQYFTNERSANYVIDKLTGEIMENKPLGSRM